MDVRQQLNFAAQNAYITLGIVVIGYDIWWNLTLHHLMEDEKWCIYRTAKLSLRFEYNDSKASTRSSTWERWITSRWTVFIGLSGKLVKWSRYWFLVKKFTDSEVYLCSKFIYFVANCPRWTNQPASNHTRIDLPASSAVFACNRFSMVWRSKIINLFTCWCYHCRRFQKVSTSFVCFRTTLLKSMNINFLDVSINID